MLGYRYNAKNRMDRKFNRTGQEKNPNALKFYGKTLEYCAKYKYILDKNNDVVYECDLESVTFNNENLFDMQKNFASLQVFDIYFKDQLRILESNNEYVIRVEKKKPKKIDVKKVYSNAIFSASSFDFQFLSDFEMQNILVDELKSKGFTGYETKNEIVIF